MSPWFAGMPSSDSVTGRAGPAAYRLPSADDERRRGRVVGDDVGHAELEVAVARVDDLERRGDRVDAVGRCRGRVVDCGGEPEGHLGLDPRMDEPGEVDAAAVRHLHGVGEPADDHVAHAHLCLLRLAGEAELHADRPLAAGDAQGEQVAPARGSRPRRSRTRSGRPRAARAARRRGAAAGSVITAARRRSSARCRSRANARPPSRPIPDSPMPPKGERRSRRNQVLTHDMPTRIRWADAVAAAQVGRPHRGRESVVGVVGERGPPRPRR